MTERTFDQDRGDGYRLALENVAESHTTHRATIDYEHEHRFAEHVHDSETAAAEVSAWFVELAICPVD